MAKMSIGGFTLPHNPSKMSLIKAIRRSAVVDTYDGIAFFSFGTLVKGVLISMEWPFMRYATFASLDGLLQADASVVINPQDGSAHTYNAQIQSFDGEYNRGLAVVANAYRTNVKMTLVITSKV